MSIKARVLEVLLSWTNLPDDVADEVSQEVATEYGRNEAARKGGKLSGSVRAGQATVKDSSGILLPATPCIRFFLAACNLRDAVEKISSKKGAYGFDCAETPRLSCPGLVKAFSHAETPETATVET